MQETDRENRKWQLLNLHLQVQTAEQELASRKQDMDAVKQRIKHMKAFIEELDDKWRILSGSWHWKLWIGGRKKEIDAISSKLSLNRSKLHQEQTKKAMIKEDIETLKDLVLDLERTKVA